MDKALQKKLVGAAVLIALVVIFLPMLLDGGNKEEKPVSVVIKSPDKPTYEVPNRLERPQPMPQPVQQTMTQPGNPQIAAPPSQPSLAAQAGGQAPQVAPIQPPPVEKIQSLTPAPKPVTRPAPVATAKPHKPATTRPTRPVTKKTAPHPDRAGKGAGYVVQVGSFSLRKNAAAMRDKLKRQGFPAFVQEVEIRGKPIFRVKVGPRPRRDDVDQLRLRLIDKAHVEGIIVTHP